MVSTDHRTMSRLADPTICPDCRGRLDVDGRCLVCGLRLQGPLAAELYRTMLVADGLVDRLRRQAPPALAAPATSATSAPRPPAPVAPAVPAPPVAAPPAPPAPQPAAVPTGHSVPAGQGAGLPAYPPLPQASGPSPDGLPPAPRRGLASASVPVVLLSLGGLCLVVFAAIFLGVAWDLLGLWGRSLVMLGVTLLLALGAALVTRRGLRASAETLWVVVGVVLALDLYAASAADLLVTGLSGRATSTVVGVALLVLGAGVATWARRTRCERLVGPQVVAVLGLSTLCAAQVFTRDHPAAAAAVLVGALLPVAWVLWRLRLPWAAGGTVALALLHWLVLLLLGASRTSTLFGDGADATWWWPLLAAAAYAVVVVLVPRGRLWPALGDGAEALVRSVAAAATLVPLLLLVTADRLTESASLAAVLLCVAQLGLCLLLALGPVVWARGAAPLAALGAVGLVTDLALHPAVTIGEALAGSATLAADRTLPAGGEVHPLVWLLQAAVVALSAAALLGVRGPGLLGVYADGRARGEAPALRESATALAVGALALGGWGAVLAVGPLLWAAVLAGLLALGATGWAAWWFRLRLAPGLLASAGCLWIGGLVTWLALASDSLLLEAVVLTALCLPLAAAGVARDLAGAAWSGAALLGVAALLGAGAVATWAAWLGAGADVGALLLAAYAAALLLLARHCATQPPGRLLLELTAVPVTLAALLVGEHAAIGSLVLTVVATALAVSGSRHPDREPLAWGAVVVALVAFVWRGGAGFDLPELASLPAGVVLLAAGALRLQRDPAVSSARALGSGLGLALVPSLLLTLPDPVTLRGALTAAAAVAVLLVGVLRHLSAPFVVGAVATGVLVLRHLGPVADAVPRWMVIGVVGVALLVAGITWEAGLRNLARARRYVVSLR